MENSQIFKNSTHELYIMTKKNVKTSKKETISTEKAQVINKNLVTKDMTIGEILEKCPASAIIMASYGLHCVGCAISTSETLEDGCKSHMLSDEDINSLVKDINKEIKKD
jgi:hybrid cluster-associated redox disulfide protein